ncbi:MAG: arginine--tRNA ligase [Candidatus Omnitrophota bacterium]
MRIEKELTKLLQKTTKEVFSQLKENDLAMIEIELPKDKNYGDFSSNLAMKLAKTLKMPPLEIAQTLQNALSKKISKGAFLDNIRVEKPGYMNFFLKKTAYYDFLVNLLKDPNSAISEDLGKGKKVQIEFVSANPTGPLSVAHGRQAAVGESLSRIFELFNYKVTKEFYLNDEGNQINLLGVSILARLYELQDKPFSLPPDGYQGEYIKDIAKAFLAKIKKIEESKLLESATEFGLKFLLEIIKKELEDFGVKFDVWYSQKNLRTSGKIEAALKFLKCKNYVYEKDGATWFKSMDFGDDKDRVLVKSDGTFTYLTPDIAYHQDKFKRGFDRVINIWGPDHHGYIPRIFAAVQALGIKKDRLSIIIVQLARIFKAGVPLVMSTRKAQYITLREVMDEVGSDVAKFFFLSRRTDSHLDFDLELAKRQSNENPVYYIQYAYARIAGIFKLAKEKKIKEVPHSKTDFTFLKEEEEKELLRLVFRFRFSLLNALSLLDSYPISQYLIELATEFHKFYDKHKVLVEGNPELANARLKLCQAVRVVILEGLELLAINAPERM